MLAKRLDLLGFVVFACCADKHSTKAKDLAHSGYKICVLELDMSDEGQAESTLQMVEKQCSKREVGE